MVTAGQILTEQHVSSVYNSPYELCDATKQSRTARFNPPERLFWQSVLTIQTSETGFSGVPNMLFHISLLELSKCQTT